MEIQPPNESAAGIASQNEHVTGILMEHSPSLPAYLHDSIHAETDEEPHILEKAVNSAKELLLDHSTVPRHMDKYGVS